jgi:single-strand DNA-binding protein
MSSVNKAIVVGYLGKAPELRYAQDGNAIANLSIATSSKYKNKAGETIEETEWHRISLFGRLAEIAGEYLGKGSLVYFEGRIKTRKYTDKEGIERYATEIIANSMQMLGGKSSDNQDQERKSVVPSVKDRPASAAPSRGFDDMDDDIPF